MSNKKTLEVNQIDDVVHVNKHASFNFKCLIPVIIFVIVFLTMTTVIYSRRAYDRITDPGLHFNNSEINCNDTFDSCVDCFCAWCNSSNTCMQGVIYNTSIMNPQCEYGWINANITDCPGKVFNQLRLLGLFIGLVLMFGSVVVSVVGFFIAYIMGVLSRTCCQEHRSRENYDKL